MVESAKRNMRLGFLELAIFLVPIVYTVIVYMVGKKIGYGRALKDVAEGKFPALTNKNEPD